MQKAAISEPGSGWLTAPYERAPQQTILESFRGCVGLGELVMITLAALLLLAGFAGGYGVREIVSRRRRAAEKRGYLERKAAAAQIEVHPRPTIVRSPGPS